MKCSCEAARSLRVLPAHLRTNSAGVSSTDPRRCAAADSRVKCANPCGHPSRASVAVRWVCHSLGMNTTVMSIAKQIKSEADAYAYMESLRWPDGPICPHCGSIEKHYFLKPRTGTARKTRTGSLTERRLWKCSTCRKQFSVITGTVFHGTKVPLHTWLMVVFEMC